MVLALPICWQGPSEALFPRRGKEKFRLEQRGAEAAWWGLSLWDPMKSHPEFSHMQNQGAGLGATGRGALDLCA